MIEIRKREQKKAAFTGEFSAVVLLNHASSCVKDPNNPDVIADLEAILTAAAPENVYTHNLADKHDTHVAVILRVLTALRRLPSDKRPRRVIGCEVWRDLDWLGDEDKVVMAVGGHESLEAALLGVFDSQIGGGKRYDSATRGRRLANATFFESHVIDKRGGALIWGIDLTSLAYDEKKDPSALVEEYIGRFTEDVRRRIAKLS
jgi:LmbE family N-acetylglucosaminyl deacetylase